MGTYSDQTRLLSATDCTDCPAGYYCNNVAITSFKKYPCPKGQYCNSRTLAPTNCPSGTYRNLTGGRQQSDCSACPAGFYCPEATVTPIQCRGATNCPQGSKFYKTCNGGFFCNADNNHQETICPMNYYCPRGTQQPI